MMLERLHEYLHWPCSAEIFAPRKGSIGVLASLVEQKLGRVIRGYCGDIGINIGIITNGSRAEAQETPIAIVCSFPSTVNENTLIQLHRLAWSFCRLPLLITVEPALVRIWSCYEPPIRENESLQRAQLATIRDADLGDEIQSETARSFSWTELITGSFYDNYKRYFKPSHRADKMLLTNLQYVRNKLVNDQLPVDVVHDLLARLIFIQFLEHRKDSLGNPALNPQLLSRLHEDGVLAYKHKALSSVLANHADAYSLFKWLNCKFNGDLFPGKGATPQEQEAEWHEEMSLVKPRHLHILGQFVSGSLHMDNGQQSLWPLYSFDAIPLEFISSIYEEFVTNTGNSRGAHYTPMHVVDFLLDSVLPWEGEEWNLKIIDPACGSGIFLVKAYQRLVYRWRKTHGGTDPDPKFLKDLLENNLFGVDIDPHAVRVASFSLYLTMCDEIDPRRYWEEMRFPRLRGHRLIDADFFTEDVEGFRTKEDTETYDITIGNAPWGKGNITDLAHAWAEEYNWTVSYEDIGSLFLPKAAMLTKDNGRVCMLQSANKLLFNRSSTAIEFRKQLFTRFKVEEITNLSALRFTLFRKAIGPACAITLRPISPDSSPFIYICPKPTETSEDEHLVQIDFYDINEVYPDEAAENPFVWTALTWGGRRDLLLLRRLSAFPTLDKDQDIIHSPHYS